MLEYILLGFLMQRSQNGYKIKQYMSLSTSNFMDASYGSLYPALKRLVKKGLAAIDESVENGKCTKIYSITEDGRKAFLQWLSVPADISGKPHDHVTKLYFYDYLDEDTKLKHFEHYIESAKVERQKLIDTLPLAKKTAGINRLSTLDYGIGYYDHLIEFYLNLFRSAK